MATVVEHHPMPGGGDGYSIEVFDALGNTIAVMTLPESHIEPLKQNEVFSARSLTTPDQGDFDLYHYTTPEALKEIIEKRQIWASLIFFLNDSEEWYLGMKLFEERLKLVNPQHPLCQHLLHAVESATEGEERGGFAPEKSLAMYVCSFSRDGDLLSQWRAYCPKGGFALGFPKSKLESLAKDQHFVFRPCLYETDDQIRIVDQTLKRIWADAPQACYPNQDQGLESKEYGQIINKSIWEIMRTAAILKHRGFREEQEWRLASTLEYTGESEQIEFHANESIIVPHRVIDLSDADLWNHVSIVVGPSPHKNESEKVVRDLLWSKRRVLTAKIRSSTIPYRRTYA